MTKTKNQQNDEITVQEIEQIKQKMRDMVDSVSPKKLYDYLNQYVIGQDEAKKYVSVAVYNHYKRFMDNIYGFTEGVKDNPYSDVKIDKSCCIIAGPTGSGKTYMIKMLADYLDIPYYISDVSRVTESGYVGDDVETVILGALRDSNFNITATQHAIIVLDEIDKLSRKGENTSITRDVGGEGVQQSLLKIVEGTKVMVPPNGGRKHPEQQCVEVDTSNILFIGLGAFDGLEKIVAKRNNTKSIGFVQHGKTNEAEDEDPLSDLTTDDLVKFGMIPELVGRFPVITHTKHLSKEDLVKILKEPKNSVIQQFQKMLWMDNVELEFNDDALNAIAELAFKKKTGARGLRGVIDVVLADIMFEYGGYHKNKENIVVTREMVLSHNKENSSKIAA